MARNLVLQDGVDPADSDFPSGRARDDDGTGTFGTPANEAILGDMLQFFMKLMRMAAITPNNLPDSEYIGFQYVEGLIGALRATQAEINDIATTDIDTFVSPGRLAATPTVVGSFNTNKLLLYTIDIGDWNMDTTRNISIPIPAPLTRDNIRDVSVFIKSDSGSSTNWAPLNIASAATTATYPEHDGQIFVSSTNIELNRRDGGYFDSPEFDSTGYNRGYITLLLAL